MGLVVSGGSLVFMMMIVNWWYGFGKVCFWSGCVWKCR